MKASVIINYGGPEVIKNDEYPDPILTENKFVVQVKAVSINPVDFKIRQGIIKILTGRKFPKILGHDFAGVVKEVGSRVTIFKSGDRVYGYIPVVFGKTGALAEQVLVSPGKIHQIPGNMTFEEAASLPVAALTALNGLRKAGLLQGKKVLINGATGGVGHFAIQIAKAKEAIVTAICSEKNFDLAKQLGADQCFDYAKNNLSALNEKFDAIFDAYGKMEYETVCRLLNRGGMYASTLFNPITIFSSVLLRIVFNKKLTSSNMRAKPEDFLELERLFNEQKLKPYIENNYMLENTKQAFEFLENGKPRGKIIIKI